MVWQDIVISLTNILFGYSLIYQVYLGFKERKGFLAIQTSLPTTIGLYALSFTFFTLKLYLSTIISFFNGSLWLILLVQKIVYKKT
jgi:hypothetical protein